jgi:hypothetical protein
MVEQVTIDAPVPDAPQPTAPAALREVPEVVRDDRGLPWLGRLFDYVHDPVAFLRHQWETYGPV